jgi:hypothetical protein
MATNAAPIYGKQYVRYAETFEAAVDTQGGSIGTVEVGELRAVSYATWAGPNVAAAGDAFTVQPTSIVGINQAYMPTAIAQPYTARQLTVATSGLLLVEVDTTLPLTPAITLNSQLQINSLGQATTAGTPVLMNGTQPLIRENVTVGGRRLVLVSFA